MTDKPKRGRAHKLTAYRRPLLIEGTRAGLTRELTAMRASVSLAAFMEWLAQGRVDRDQGLKPWPWDPVKKEWLNTKTKGLSKEMDLVEQVEKSESDRLTEALLSIREAGKGGKEVATEEVTETAPDGTQRTTRRTRLMQPDWKAFAWLAERTRPRDYGGVNRTEVSGPDGGPVQVRSLVDLINKAAAEEDEEERKKGG